MVVDPAVPFRDHAVEEQRRIRRRAGQWARDHQPAEGVDPASRRDQTARGFEADKSARRRRDADGAAAVRTRREGQHPARHGDGRAAARAAGTESRVPRVPGRRSRERLGVGGQPELGRVGLAEADRTGGVERLHDLVRGVRDVVRHQARAEPGANSAALPQVLVAGGKPPERRRLRHGGRHLLGPLERAVARDGDEGSELGVQPVDPVEVVLGRIPRGHGSPLQLLPEFEGGQLMEFGHVPRLAATVDA